AIHGGRAADEHPARAQGEGFSDLRFRDEPATDLYRDGRFREHPARERAVLTPGPPPGAIEIDEGDPARPIPGVLVRHGDGIAVGRARDAPALNIDGGIEVHSCEGKLSR